jgi:hypothetical protein
MANVTYQDEGWNDLVVELVAESLQAAENAVNDAAQYTRGAVVEKLAGARTGRVYRVPGTRTATYRASAPGEPPAVMLGNLRKNVNASKAVVDGNTVSAEVGVDGQIVPYARRLEFGGFSTAANGARVYVAPRPYLRPTFFEQESVIVNILERATKR